MKPIEKVKTQGIAKYQQDKNRAAERERSKNQYAQSYNQSSYERTK